MPKPVMTVAPSPTAMPDDAMREPRHNKSRCAAPAIAVEATQAQAAAPAEDATNQ